MLEFTTVEQHKLTINPEAITAVLEHRTRKEATICFDGRSEMVESIDGAATKEWLGTTDEKKDRGPTNAYNPTPGERDAQWTPSPRPDHNQWAGDPQFATRAQNAPEFVTPAQFQQRNPETTPASTVPPNNLVPHTPAIDEGLPQTEGPHYTPPVS
jgi:hypothetical protein